MGHARYNRPQRSREHRYWKILAVVIGVLLGAFFMPLLIQRAGAPVVQQEIACIDYHGSCVELLNLAERALQHSGFWDR
jgi:hypothetical protein